MRAGHAFRCSGEHEDGFCIPMTAQEWAERPLIEGHEYALPTGVLERVKPLMSPPAARRWWKQPSLYFAGRTPQNVFAQDGALFRECLWRWLYWHGYPEAIRARRRTEHHLAHVRALSYRCELCPADVGQECVDMKRYKTLGLAFPLAGWPHPGRDPHPED